MGLSNFVDFCRKCDIISKRFPRSRIELLFKKVNIEESYTVADKGGGLQVEKVISTNDPDNPDAQFTRAEFLESLVRLGGIMFPKKDIANGLAKVLSKHVGPHAREIVESNTTRTDLQSTECHEMFGRWSKRVYGLFRKISKGHPYMNQKFFVAMFTGFPKGTMVDNKLPMRSIMQAFALSQAIDVPHRRPTPDVRKRQSMAARKNSEALLAHARRNTEISSASDTAMEYPEFIEAIARIGQQKFADIGEETTSFT
eukprot:51901_1